MPGLDKTGPVGLGAQTGRKRGQCSAETNAATELAPRGRGRMGRGFRNRRDNDSENIQGFRRGQRQGLEQGRRKGSE